MNIDYKSRALIYIWYELTELRQKIKTTSLKRQSIIDKHRLLKSDHILYNFTHLILDNV